MGLTLLGPLGSSIEETSEFFHPQVRELGSVYISVPQSLGGLTPGVAMPWHIQLVPSAGGVAPMARDSQQVKECRCWQLEFGPVCTAELGGGGGGGGGGQ